MYMRRLILVGLVLMTGFNSLASQIENALKLQLKKGNAVKDETVIRFVPGCTDGYNNGFDAQKLFSSSQVPSIYTKDTAAVPLAINSLGTFEQDRSIAVYLRIPVAGSYTISAEQLGPFESGTGIYLQDLSSNTVINLTSGEFTFVSAVTTSNPPPLFVVRFLHVPQVINTAEDTCGTYHSGMIQFMDPSGGMKNYLLTDENGSVVRSGVTTAGFNGIDSLESGSYFLSIYRDTLSFSSVETVVGLTRLPVAAVTLEDTPVAGVPVQFESSSINYSNLKWQVENIELYGPVLFHVFMSPGTFNITLTAINGFCEDTASVEVVVSAVTGISSQNANTFCLLINDKPFYIHAEEYIQVHDLNGKVILRKIVRGESSANLKSDIQSGTYVLTSERESKKIILN